MTISSDKTRTNITIEIELKKQYEQWANEDNRSFNNLVITVLKEYADKRFKKEKEKK
jgi:hypothetical protein